MNGVGEFYRDTYGNGPYPDEPYNVPYSGGYGGAGMEPDEGFPSPMSFVWEKLKDKFFSRAPHLRPSGYVARGVGVIDYIPDVDEIEKHEVSEDGEAVTPVSFMDLPCITPPEGVFCVYGRPGCGKTVFSSALVDRMLSENPGVFQHVYIFVPGVRQEWSAIAAKHKNVTTLAKVRLEILGKIIQNQKERYSRGMPNKIMVILDDQMGQGQGIHNGPLGDLIDRIAASNRQPELNIVFFVLAQHVSFIPPSMRLTTRMIAYSQPTDDSLDAIFGAQGITCNKEEIKSYAQANQFVVVDCWTSKLYATKSYHLK